MLAASAAATTLLGLSLLAPLSATAVTLPLGVTASATVYGVTSSTAYTTDLATITFKATNQTSSSYFRSFLIVIPPSATGLTLGTVTGGAWAESLGSCGMIANCGSVVVLTVNRPTTTNRLAPGASLTATIGLLPTTPGALTFQTFIPHEDDGYTPGAAPVINVIDGVVTSFGVAVAPQPVIAGIATNITVNSLNAANLVVPFKGGLVTLSLLNADLSLFNPGQPSPASINGTPLTNGLSVALTEGALNPGTFTVPAVLTVAQAQTVTATSGLVTGVSAPFVVQPGPSSFLTLDSITDTSKSPALPNPAANKAFSVAFTSFDQFDNIATTPAVPITLSALNSAGGILTVSTLSPATDGTTGHGTLSAAFSAAQNGLVLQVSSPGLTPGTRTTDVSLAGDSLLGSPNTPGTLSAGIAGANLGAGAYGTVYLTNSLCATTDPTCHGQEVSLAGLFSDPTNLASHLYSLAHPAVVTWTCATACVHPDGDKASSAYPGKFNYEGEHETEQAEDFAKYPISVSLHVNGVYLPFAVAPSCRVLTDSAQQGLMGAITNPAAVTAGFCVDVYGISRAGAITSGALTLPVLFVEDPKIRGY